jgi:hypothetical protein
MKKLLLLAAAAWLSVLSLPAQTYTVTSNTTTYSAAGGQVVLTVSLGYPAGAIPLLEAKPPASTWTHVSTAGTNTPTILPNAGDTTDAADPNSKWGWSYQEPPTSPANFTFTVGYPAGISGNQVINFTGNYRLNNVATTVTVTPITLTPTPVAPTFTTQPAAQTVLSGQNATFTAAANGVPTPTLKWQRSTDGGSTWANVDDGSAFAGTTTASLTVNAVTPAMTNHRFRAVATATGFAAVNSSPATLSVSSGPSFVVHPRTQAVAIGGTLRLGVVVAGFPAPTIQWRKNGVDLANGGRVTGATTANLSISAVEAGDAADYVAVASNSVASGVSSNAATITLAPAGYSVSHALQGAGYTAGGNITISTTINFAGSISALGYSIALPTGWEYVSGTGNTQSAPNAGVVGLLNWAWTSVSALASPVTFTYTVKVPAGTSGTFYLGGNALVANPAAEQFFVSAIPDPLVVGPVLFHSADTNGDFKISLSELLRVISYYNTVFTNTDGSKVQTGNYRVVAVSGSAPDGFSPDSTKQSAAAAGQGGLAAFHSADADRNGAISLSELLRVVSYFNTVFSNTDGTKTQTGAYRVRVGTPTSDGYEPDAARAP